VGIPRYTLMALASLACCALAIAQQPRHPVSSIGQDSSSTQSIPQVPESPSAASSSIGGWSAASNNSPGVFTDASTFDPTAGSDPRVSFSYPDTGVNSIIDTNGWPVAVPFNHYPQGMVNEDGSGIYECLLPGDFAENCFCTPPPCYFGTLTVGGVILDRRTNLRPAGIIYDPTLTTELANASDFNLETEAGFRLGFWLTHPCGLDWNLEYFNVGNFEDTFARGDVGTVNAIFFGGSFATAPTSITAEYGSDLDSLELTVRARQWRRLAPIVGFRFLQVEEEFNLLSDVSTRTGLFSTTDNELYGVQFGFQGLLYEWSRARLETTIKAGTYYNDIDIDANVSVGTAATNFTHGTNWSAFSGDARVTYVYQIGPRATFRVGYQVLWLEGIALAVNQNTDRGFAPQIQTVDISDALYQGGEIGFEISW
jgi:hypothetical protein